jgi:ribosomal protein S27AE
MSRRETQTGEVRCPRCGARLPIAPHPGDGACRAQVYCAKCGDSILAQRTTQGRWTLNFEEK